MIVPMVTAMKLVNAFRVLRMVDPEMPLLYAAIFMEVGAMSPKPFMLADVPERFGVSRATASRAHVYLSNYLINTGARKKPGYGLIRSEPSAENRKFIELTLTPKGKTVFEQVVATLERK
jgi:hypothetical protein